MSIEAMKQALSALEIEDSACRHEKEMTPEHIASSITVLRQAIVQAEKQEPVTLEEVYETIIQWDEAGGKRSRRELARRIVDLCTTPPKRPVKSFTGGIPRYAMDAPIEAKLKERNT
jgi:DNA-binding XRE family transcriptional regulator